MCGRVIQNNGPFVMPSSMTGPVVHGSSDPPSSKGSHIQGMYLRLDRGPLPSATIHRIVYAKGLPKQLRQWCSEIHYSDVLAYTNAWPPVAFVPKARPGSASDRRESRPITPTDTRLVGLRRSLASNA
jgi:hypothetical protein